MSHDLLKQICPAGRAHRFLGQEELFLGSAQEVVGISADTLQIMAIVAEAVMGQKGVGSPFVQLRPFQMEKDGLAAHCACHLPDLLEKGARLGIVDAGGEREEGKGGELAEQDGNVLQTLYQLMQLRCRQRGQPAAILCSHIRGLLLACIYISVYRRIIKTDIEMVKLPGDGGGAKITIQLLGHRAHRADFKEMCAILPYLLRNYNVAAPAPEKSCAKE